MSIPILATKLFIPPTGRSLVFRPHLLEKLDACLQPGCRLTLVSAPPGFGKTTLLSAWVARLQSMELQPPPSIAWLSLDAGDDDSAIFWTYLITALQSAQEGIGTQALSLLQAVSPPDLEGVLTSLVNNLARIATPLVLILDDYHLVRSAEIHRSLAYLIEHMPPKFHLLILSRTNPPLRLSLLRGRGQLLEVRLADLRFSNEEATLYLNEGLKLSLPAEAVDTLNAKTEGWAAGLQMAGISIQGRQEPSQFIQTFSGSNSYILDYLTGEILDGQPDEVRTFLLHTAVLEQLSAPLCDAVLGGSIDSQTLLEQLEKANLFLIPLDQQRHWFRYHRLFADLLRAKLVQSDRSLPPVLQKRAARWFETNGMLEEAVFYSHAAQDQDGLVRLIEENIQPMIQKGRILNLGSWVRFLPEDLVFCRPKLCLLSGWVLIAQAEFEKGAASLERAEELIAQVPADQETGEMLGIIYALRTQILENSGDIPGTIAIAHQALELLDPNNVVTRASVDYTLGRAYYVSGDLAQADRTWSEFIRMAVQARTQSIYAIIMGIRSYLLAIQGKLQEAIDIDRQAIDYMTANDISRFFCSGSPYFSLGMQLFQRNNLEEAEKFVDEGVKQNRSWGNLNTIAIGLSYQARLRIACGDLEAASACLLEEERLNQGYRPYFEVTSHYLACRVRIFLAKGEIAAAAQIVKAHGLRSDDPLSFRSEQDHISLSRVLIAQGSYDQAGGLLLRLAEAAQAGGRFGRLIEILNLRAVALSALGRNSEAIQVLNDSLDMAESEGYIRLFIDEGEPMAKLLEMAALNEPHSKYASLLLAAFPGSFPQGQTMMKAQKHNLNLVEPLSGREIEVLQWIGAGLSNKEIAKKLCISVRTVKYHTTNIFAKLEVDKRTQAVIKAREAGLLK